MSDKKFLETSLIGRVKLCTSVSFYIIGDFKSVSVRSCLIIHTLWLLGSKHGAFFFC